ncbi:MAG: nuclear transport factor 2 family protein [Pseudomonadales bacterium]
MSRESALAQVAAVEYKVPRETIRAAIQAYLDSYPAADFAAADKRAELFADDLVLEDPVGATPITNKAGLLAFFQGPVTYGIIIRMKTNKIVISGDEAISLTSASWGQEGEEPARVDIIHHFAFNEAGEITRVRVFFDEGCVA